MISASTASAARRRRPAAPQLRLDTWSEAELFVDLFAGGGGASEGIKAAIGRDPDIAVNHNPAAIAMHAANHPATRHFCESVYTVDPLEVCGGRPVWGLWASPDCTHHSKAKGGKPRKKKIRGLAWVVCRWAKAVRPRVIFLENVEEFADWGPLDENNKPIAALKGKTFRAWKRKLERYGYEVEHRILVAADYGAPTTRRRLYLIARRDGEPITWPEPTHAKMGKGRRRWRAAAEVIDWSIPCRSIFERKKPLAEPTMRRIAVGIWRYVIDAAAPFIVPVTHPRDRRVHGIHEPVRTATAANRGELAAFLTKHYGSPPHRMKAVGHEATAPLSTVTTQDHHALSTAFLMRYQGGERGTERVATMTDPLGTITTARRFAEVRAFLAAYDRAGAPHVIGAELDARTAKGLTGIVTISGEDFAIVDIGMRMLTPRELFRAQGFGDHYAIDPIVERVNKRGKWIRHPLGKTGQTAMAGNSVCPPIAEKIVRANLPRRAEVACA